MIWNRYIAYVPHSYRLWSTLWHRIPPSPSYLFPGVITLACFTFLEWVVHINGVFVLEKDIPCSSFTKKCFPARMRNVWEICVGMFITSNKWLKKFLTCPPPQHVKKLHDHLKNLTDRTRDMNLLIHRLSLSKRKY